MPNFFIKDFLCKNKGICSDTLWYVGTVFLYEYRELPLEGEFVVKLHITNFNNDQDYHEEVITKINEKYASLLLNG